MLHLKKIIAKNFTSFTYFYRQLRYRIFVLLILSICVGIMDGFGLAMFIPLLEIISNSEDVTGASLGKLGFLVELFAKMGLDLNLVTILLAMVFFFSLKGVAKFSSLAYSAFIHQYFIQKLRKQLISNFLMLQYKHFVTSDIGRVQNTMGSEVERVSIAFQNYLWAMREGVQVFAYMGLAFFVDSKFASLVLVGGALASYLYKMIYKRTIAASRRFSQDSHVYQGLIIQLVNNFKYLKATSCLNDYAKRILDSVRLIERSRLKMSIFNAIMLSTREPLMICIVSIIIIVQSLFIQEPLVYIIVSLMFFYRALTSLTSMQNAWNQFLNNSGSLENVISFQRELENNSEKRVYGDTISFDNKLELKSVSFSYDKVDVLKEINLLINKNETIAFVGKTGCGKTTLINVLTGLLPASNGSFLIDGKEIHEINIESYRKRIGYISQDPVIFNDTVFNNITFWDEPTEESLARFKNAMQMSSIEDFVNSLPSGLDTVLGHNGINLSGGQKQRISIARELYKGPVILVLDEATSALDSETEKDIQNSIDILKGKCTILTVAHRISTIKNADRIVLIKNGMIEAVSSYELLVRDRKSTRLNSSHTDISRMPSSA